MWLIMLEAGVALLLLILIVWWTMFSGRESDSAQHQKKSLRGKEDAD